MSRTHCEFYKRYCEYQTIVKYYSQVSLVHSIIARCLLHANQAAKSSIIALRDLTWNCKILKVICEKVEISIVANIYMITCAIHHCMVWDMLVIGLFRNANGSYSIVFVYNRLLLLRDVRLFATGVSLLVPSLWWCCYQCTSFRWFGLNGRIHQSL